MLDASEIVMIHESSMALNSSADYCHLRMTNSIGCKADAQQIFCDGQILTRSLCSNQSFKRSEKRGHDGQKSARSGSYIPRNTQSKYNVLLHVSFTNMFFNGEKEFLRKGISIKLADVDGYLLVFCLRVRNARIFCNRC